MAKDSKKKQKKTNQIMDWKLIFDIPNNNQIQLSKKTLVYTPKKSISLHLISNAKLFKPESKKTVTRSTNKSCLKYEKCLFRKDFRRKIRRKKKRDFGLITLGISKI